LGCIDDYPLFLAINIESGVKVNPRRWSEGNFVARCCISFAADSHTSKVRPHSSTHSYPLEYY